MSNSLILRVAVNAPLSRLFDYLPPRGLAAGRLQPGMRLTVPFGRQTQIAVLLELAATSEVPQSKLRRALELIDDEPLLRAPELWLLRFTSDYYHHPVGEVTTAALPAALRQGKPLHPVAQRLAVTAAGREVDLAALQRRAPKQAALLDLLQDAGSVGFGELDLRLPGWRRIRKRLVDKSWTQVRTVRDAPDDQFATGEAQPGPMLNSDQNVALAAIRKGDGFRVALLDGVTGSGKTEVYLRLMRDALDLGKQVLVLVPEIGLTPQLLERLQKRLGVRPALLHSSLSDNARLAAWRAARSGAAQLILGTRSAVFAPLKNPGLVVVDEEHDSSLKQQEGLRYSARDLAIARAKHLHIPVVLGSATPSLESLQRCRDGAYQHLLLPTRAGNAAPPLLRLVDLSTHPADDGLSDAVITAIRDNLSAGGQVLVFLNRRGFAPTLICSACGGIAECNRCDARMTVHVATHMLMCHHCGATRPLDVECTDCGGKLLPLGQGTERLEDALRAHFPERTITRVDSDSTRLKGTMDKALAMATAGDTQILVGTQMLSKGHHFPKLTLVVVINADQGLFSTDFRGSERLAQSLVQVAGRAGREKRQGQVIIQTAFPQHPFWHELFSGGYERVTASALAEREEAAWPPFSRLALLRASAPQRQDMREFLDFARELADQLNDHGVRILGPVSAPMERRGGRYRGQLLLQSINRQALHALLGALCSKIEGSKTARRVRWSIDVDPIELF